MGVAAPDTHFLLLGSDLKSFHSLFHNQGVDALVTFFWIGLGYYQVYIGGRSVGDPVFGSVQHVVIPLIDGGGFLGGSITAGFRFR